MSVQIKLSVVIITFNEERNIGNCIDSILSIADEVVVVDSFSTDQTVAIAKSKGAKVFQHPFSGHIEQKNYAITQAINPYILSLDADEKPDAIFLKEIDAIKHNWAYDGYSVNRLNNYCGKWIRHGAWYPDIKLRLWDSRKGAWGGTNPHDRFEMTPDSNISHVQGHLLHYSYQTVAEHLRKTDYFSSIAASAYLKNGRKSSWFSIILSPLFRFLRDYIFKLGFMDGSAGLTIARITAYEVYLKYTKLKKIQH
jgi:glycosyltransferase involved in cell wall biosynthesis